VSQFPGSGKTTFANKIIENINSKKSNPKFGKALPMDGFHFYKCELDQMKDVKEAYKRRGAPWTFNSTRFLACISRIKNDLETEIGYPSFDHRLGDPVEDDILIISETKLVIIEGLYLCHDSKEDENWKKINDQLNETWFIQCPISIAMKRILKRHVQSGWDIDYARERIETNDQINSELVLQCLINQGQNLQFIDNSNEIHEIV